MKFSYQAEFLRNAKYYTGKTNAEIAAALGISEVYVSHMVNGKVGIPPERVHALVKFFDHYVLNPNRFLDAAVKDYSSIWRDAFKKALNESKTKGKAPRHEKTKVKKQKRKT